MKTEPAYPIVVRPVLVTAALLMLPLLAMQFVEGEGWSLFDFAFVGTFLFGATLAYEMASRKEGSAAYRIALGVALASAFFLIFVSQGVSIIGSDGDPANLMYFGVVAVGVVAAILGRFEARGMARAMLAMAVAQVLVAVIALVLGLGQPASPPMEILGLTGMFCALFVAAAWLFQRAAEGQTSRA